MGEVALEEGKREGSEMLEKAAVPASVPAPVKAAVPAPAPVTVKPRMSFKEKREFELLDSEIATLNKEKNDLGENLRRDGIAYDEVQKLSARFEKVSGQLQEKELRWLELSEMAE